MYLSRLWQVIVKRIKKLKSPAEIYQESEMVTRTIRDNFAADIDAIWVDEKNAFEAAQEFMQVVMPRYADRIKFYEARSRCSTSTASRTRSIASSRRRCRCPTAAPS